MPALEGALNGKWHFVVPGQGVIFKFLREEFFYFLFSNGALHLRMGIFGG